MTGLPETITFANNDPVLPDVLRLMEVTYLGMVEMEQVRGLTGTSQTILRPIRPLDLWSSGEYAIWTFLASLAGAGSVNLYALAAHSRGNIEQEALVAFAVIERLRGTWR